MNHKNLTYIFPLLAIQLAVLISIAQDNYPEPPKPAGHLFYLQHTRNKNTVVYEVNRKQGEIDTDSPVHVYWIRYDEKGQKEELTYLQQKFAYGMHAERLADKTYVLNLNADKKYKLLLRETGKGAYQIFVRLNNKEVILERIFVHIIGGSIMSPKIDYIDIHGADPKDGQPVAERFFLHEN